MSSPALAVEPSPPAKPAPHRQFPGLRRIWVPALVLFPTLYLAASLFQRYLATRPAVVALGSSLLDARWHNIVECVAIGISIAAGLLFARRAVKPMLRAEQAF